MLDSEATVAAPALGVTDDGSGTAAVMELARVMSQYRFRKTLVFIAFAAEEYGLFGSGLYAENAAPATRSSKAFSTTTSSGVMSQEMAKQIIAT